MGKLKFNLMYVFLLKEVVFWKRTWQMHKKFKLAGKIFAFPIALLMVAIGHYAFAIMHFGFESFLWVVHRGQFKINLNKMKAQLSM